MSNSKVTVTSDSLNAFELFVQMRRISAKGREFQGLAEKIVVQVTEEEWLNVINPGERL